MPLPTENTPSDDDGGFVPPAWKVCKLSDVASFQPGTWNGKDHDAEFVKKLVANFAKYSTGRQPYYVPYISINHDDKLQAGKVAAARLKPGHVLSLDGADIPEPVGAWRNAGGLVQPSIEYFEPVYDEFGALVDGFRKPDGSIEDGPVLKCLTLLGADAPAVKGLPPLPFAKFSHVHGGRVRKFSNTNEGNGMDRAAMLAALQAMSVDTSSITDVVPDEVIKAWLESLQAASAAPVAPVSPDVPAPQMSDIGAGVGAAAPAAGIPGIGSAQPSSVVLKFADTTPAALRSALAPIMQQTQAFINSIYAKDAQRERAHQQNANAAKFADVTAFVSKLATPDAKGFVRITHAQKPFYVAALMKFDSAAVRKFADGKTQGTEMQEQRALLEATLPRVRMGDKMPDPGSDQPGKKAGTSATGAAAMDSDRRRKMLAASPQGRQILAREGAAK